MSLEIKSSLCVMELNDETRNLLISMNTCSMKNMIQLSNLDLYDVITLYSCKDLYDSDTIMNVLCLGKCF